MLSCYRVSQPEISADRSNVTISTHRLRISATNFESIVSLLVPGAVFLGRTTSLFDESTRFKLSPAQMGSLAELLAAHAAPTVTVMTDAELSVCMDFHSVPPVDGGGWTRTRMGGLVYKAKYQDQKKYGPRVAAKVADYVAGHPLLRAVDLVAPMPGSSLGIAEQPGLVSGVSKEVARRIECELVWIERATKPQHAQKNLPLGIDPDENQRNTMAIPGDVQGKTVLIVDDLMREGGTLREAVRVLRQGGATQIYSLSFTKDVKGTRGGYFE